MNAINSQAASLQGRNIPALKISGNPQASGGNNDIYSFFNAYIDLPDTDYEGMSGVPYFFVVRNTEYNIQYILIHNKAKSFGAARDGLLKMGVSVPKGYRLMDGKNPYDLLMEVYHTMLRENMTPTDVANEYQYKAQMCPPEVFEQILRQYPFEPCRSVYRQMKGSTPVLLLTDRVRDFMQDTQYTELQAYKEVIVSQQGLFPAKVSLPDIPRKPQYQLFVNNQQVQWPNDPWGEQPVTVSRIDFDARCFKVTPITFSLRAIVREGKPAPAGVTVDMEQETVRCTLQLQPLTKELHLQLEGVERADEQKVLKRLQCTVNGVQKLQPGQKSLRLVGEEIIAQISGSYSGDDYILLSSERTADDKVKVLFKAKPKPVEKTYTVKLDGVKEKDIAQVLAKTEYVVAGVKRKLIAASFKLIGDEASEEPHFSYTGDDWELLEQRLENGQTFRLKFEHVDQKPVSGDELWIVLPLLSMSDKKTEAKVEIYPSGDDSGLRLYKKLKFEKENGLWRSKSFALPADKWEGGNKKNYHLKLKTTLGSFEEEVSITSLSNEMQLPGRKKRRGFVLDEGQFKKYSFVERYRMIVLISLLAVLFVLGGLVGWFVRPSMAPAESQQTDSTQVNQPSEQGTGNDEQTKTRDLYARLSAVDLTFAEVKELNSLVSAHPEYVDTLCLDADKIKAYNDVVSVILDWKTTKDTWRYTRFKGMVNASPLEQIHKEYVACLCDVNINHDIDAVKKYFQAHADDFQSFQDLEKLPESIISASATETAKPQKQSQPAKSKPSAKGTNTQGANGGSGSTQSGNPMFNH